MATNRRKHTWMAEMERLATIQRPELSGKIDWNTAIFLFNSGVSPMDAAPKIVAAFDRDKDAAS